MAKETSVNIGRWCPPNPSKAAASRPSHLQDFANVRQQDLVLVGLDDPGHHARVFGLGLEFRVGLRGQDEDRHVKALLFQVLAHRESIHARHVQVCDHQVHAVAAHGV